MTARDDITDREEGPGPKRTKFSRTFKYITKYCKAQSQYCISFTPSNPFSEKVIILIDLFTCMMGYSG